LNMTNQRNKKKGKKTKKAKRFLIAKKCRFCEAGILDIDYKDAGALRRHLSSRGKILAARYTGTCARHQRKLGNAIKRSRYMALLPYIVR